MSKVVQKKQVGSWLWWVFAITLGVSIWSAFHGDKVEGYDTADIVLPRKTISSSMSNSHMDIDLKADSQKAVTIAWDKLDRVNKSKMMIDLFKPHSWAPPPAKVKLPTPASVAPPVPFQYFGKLEDTPQGAIVFLLRFNKVYSVTIGQKIDSQWRLDSEDAQTLKLTYLPLNLPQSLSKMTNQVPAPQIAPNPIQESL